MSQQELPWKTPITYIFEGICKDSSWWITFLQISFTFVRKSERHGTSLIFYSCSDVISSNAQFVFCAAIFFLWGESGSFGCKFTPIKKYFLYGILNKLYTCTSLVHSCCHNLNNFRIVPICLAVNKSLGFYHRFHYIIYFFEQVPKLISFFFPLVQARPIHC
jgi:hypothetical protein